MTRKKGWKCIALPTLDEKDKGAKIRQIFANERKEVKKKEKVFMIF